MGPIKAGAPARERRRQLCGRVISIAATLFKLQNEHLSHGADDSPGMRDFKRDLRRSLNDQFSMSKGDTASHPFVVAAVLDPTRTRQITARKTNAFNRL